MARRGAAGLPSARPPGGKQDHLCHRGRQRERGWLAAGSLGLLLGRIGPLTRKGRVAEAERAKGVRGVDGPVLAGVGHNPWRTLIEHLSLKSEP